MPVLRHDLRAEPVPVSRLRPWSRNPRVNDAAAARLARTIEAHGWTTPILAQRSSGRVVAGHTRLKAAAILGLSEVPVVWLDVDDQRATEIALADNRLGELAEWDEAGLDDLLDELLGQGTDLADLAFEDRELAALFEHDGLGAGPGASRRGQQPSLMLNPEQHEAIERAVEAAIAAGSSSRAQALAEISRAYLGEP